MAGPVSEVDDDGRKVVLVHRGEAASDEAVRQLRTMLHGRIGRSDVDDFRRTCVGVLDDIVRDAAVLIHTKDQGIAEIEAMLRNHGVAVSRGPFHRDDLIRGSSVQHIVMDDLRDALGHVYAGIDLATPTRAASPAPSFRSRYLGLCCMLAYARRFR